MKIIIAGAGDVGFHLAELLSYENQEITVIDVDDEKLTNISNKLDVATIKGSSTSYKVLEDANVSEADLLIAVTSIEEINITTSIFAKNLGAKKTVARIKNLDFIQEREKTHLKQLGIDELISPESLASDEIKRLLKSTSLTDIFHFEDGKLTLLGILIDYECKLCDLKLIDTPAFNPDNDFIIVAILRGGKTIVPHGNDVLLNGDHAYFVATPTGVEKIQEFSFTQRSEIKNVMVLGGSKIGEIASKRLSKEYDIKLIEQNKEKCFNLADELPETLVIHGDGRNTDLIESEGINNMDAFIAVTGNSETNILSCLVAKEHGVGKTIALVENVEYIHLSQNIGIDTMINRKLIAANFIFRYIRKGDIISITSIHGVDAEILEFYVKENSKITKQYIKNLNFPEGAIIGGVVRKDIPRIANGDFRIRPDDKVVVLCTPKSIHKVETFF